MRRTCLKLLHSSRSLHSANTAKPASHTLRLAAGVRALNTSTTLQTQLQASAASISNVFTARYQELVGEGTIRHDEAQVSSHLNPVCRMHKQHKIYNRF